MKFEDQTFTGDVTWDFNTFVNCTFAPGCTIHFHGFDFSLVDVKFDRVRFAIHGPANSTLVFLKLIRQFFPEQVEQMINDAGNATPAPPGTKTN